MQQMNRTAKWMRDSHNSLEGNWVGGTPLYQAENIDWINCNQVMH